MASALKAKVTDVQIADDLSLLNDDFTESLLLPAVSGASAKWIIMTFMTEKIITITFPAFSLEKR